MKLFVFFFFSFFLLSCQFSLSNWLSNLKDYSLTTLASQVINHNISPEDREDLLYLFYDIREASTCSQVQRYIEIHPTLRFFEDNFDLPRGFAFDVFLDYDYEQSLLNVQRTQEENVIFTVVSVWKTEFSLEEIKEVIVAIRKCYPYD